MAAHQQAVNWSAPAPSRWFISKPPSALTPLHHQSKRRGAIVHANVDGPHRVRQAALFPLPPTPCTCCGP